ncbi:Fc.00g087330.m01.CDS01 [Cosmosporella sp. VM-42]
MASSASLKELSKAIVTFLPEATLPLPEDLSEVIRAYRRRHIKHDDAASDRLQEELYIIFDKYVKHNPTARAPWLAILRRLFSVLRTPDRIFALWDTCTNLLDKTNPEKDVVDESSAGMMDIIKLAEEYTDSDEGDLSSDPLIDRLVTTWMDNLYPATSEGDMSTDYSERLTRDALVTFGKRHPKDLFTALNRYFVKKQYRKAVLRFLGDYLQSQPPHLHQVLQTPLFTNILECLLHDTSTTIVSAALTALIMLLPHMPSSLVPHLPTLFNVYARLLFWPRERSRTGEQPSDQRDQTGGWEVCTYIPDIDDHPVDHLLEYYTILYGLYPINFMDYIRKPQRYLRHANVANANDIEVQPTEIRDKSERFRRQHLLHPNFYTLTIDSEKTDLGRWIKSEASEVVAECMGLCLVTESNDFTFQNLPSISPAPAPLTSEGSVKDEDPALLSSSTMIEPHGAGRLVQSASMESVVSHPGSQSSRADSPTLPPHLIQSSSHTQLQDMIQSNKAIKSGLHQSLTNDSVPSLSLSHHDSVIERIAPPSILAPPTLSSPLSLTETNTQVAHLQRRILLLQNDLNFERYMKQQHLAHIGDLRRKQMEEAVTEAETQNLIMLNRNLNNRFEAAKNAEMQVRRDSEKSRALAKKWEADLANKLKTLRDDSKRMKIEIDRLGKDLENSKAEREKLRNLVCEAEGKELNWKQNMQSIEIHGAEVDRLKSEVDRLTVEVRDYQAKELERQTAINSASEAEGKAEELRMKLEARENDLERTKKLFQSQIAALQTRLSESQEDRGRVSPHVRAAIDTSLAASREKQVEMEKQYKLLSRKYTALQSSLLDMKTGATPNQLKIETSNLSDGDGDYLSMSTSPVMMKTRLHRVTSNPERTEGTSFNVTAPLDPMAGGWSQQGVPSDGSGSAKLSMSPERRLATRSHSDLFSSGVQNRIRKEAKDKGKEEDKKGKKASRLGGIRGFV